MSKMSGIPQKTISRIETGVSVPNFKTVISLVEALKKEVVFNLI
ncbi:helix-turn-helix transcriptional regulator [Listeria monocytogenes]|nr:XRE family transcriptional regulator [Listeria monocytogenes]EAF1536333.1 XRE family transcriptional regulator [Listeria monocytogenes]EIZ2475621.1 helix-turn-helix transcriptional regulator [Listeria monocytogenes]EKZ0944694.1 helix-turn-helix transcriptional regulator [Listeria monocytogenes]EKZ0975421.1 helix-turn-helix transcriptional regulator [Listeria monocytogenes]